GRQLVLPKQPDEAWTKRTLDLTAAPNAHKAYVYVLLSMLGDLWVDDLALTITGGERPGGPELLVREDFPDAKHPRRGWKKKIGANNGTGGNDSKVEIDPERGAADSPRSLHLSGDAATLHWNHLSREFPAEPGQLWHWSGKVASEDVRREGPQ